MNWKFVYNPKANSGFESQDEDARSRAKTAGYKFYMWNNLVRFTSDGECTGISEKDMI